MSEGPKKSAATVNELLKKDPKKLSASDQRKLLKHADHLLGDGDRNWMTIGQCVHMVCAGSPKQTRGEREKLFAGAFRRLDYQTAMKSQRVYKAYKDSPDEVARYGLDLADRLKEKSKKSRDKLWKEHGSRSAVKKSLTPRKSEAAADHWIGLGEHNDLIVAALQKQTKEVILACSDIAKVIRETLRQQKPLVEGSVATIKGHHHRISDKPLKVKVNSGYVAVRLHCKFAEAQSRATIIAACLGFEYLQRLIDPSDRLI